jgi:hypothetical protein
MPTILPESTGWCEAELSRSGRAMFALPLLEVQRVVEEGPGFERF